MKKLVIFLCVSTLILSIGRSATALPSLYDITGYAGTEGYYDTGAESVFLTDTDGYNDDATAYLFLENTAYEAGNRFGIYDFTEENGTVNVTNMLEIFSGGDSPLTSATLEFDVAYGTVTYGSGEKDRLDSSYLYALNGQPDSEGPVNYDIYAGFNRTIYSAGRNGTGLTKVTIKLSPEDSCEIDLQNNAHTCDTVAAIEFTNGFTTGPIDHKAVIKLNLHPGTGYTKARFYLEYGDVPINYTVNIGDSQTNNGHGGDGATQSNDAEMMILGTKMSIYPNDDAHTPEPLLERENIVAEGTTILLEVGNNYLAWDNRPTKEIDTTFGFYLTSGVGKTYYSHASLNEDNFDHMLIFDTSDNSVGSLLGSDVIIAIEDYWRGGDKDFKDMVVGMSDVNVNIIPEPSTLVLLGIGLMGFVSLLRKRSRK